MDEYSGCVTKDLVNLDVVRSHVCISEVVPDEDSVSGEEDFVNADATRLLCVTFKGVANCDSVCVEEELVNADGARSIVFTSERQVHDRGHDSRALVAFLDCLLKRRWNILPVKLIVILNK